MFNLYLQKSTSSIAHLCILLNLISYVLKVTTSSYIVNGDFTQNNCQFLYCGYDQSNFTQENLIGWNPAPQLEIIQGNNINSNLGPDYVLQLNGVGLTCNTQILVNLPKGKYLLQIFYCRREHWYTDIPGLEVFFNGSSLFQEFYSVYTVKVQQIVIDLPNGATAPILKLCPIGNIGDNLSGPLILNISLVQTQAYPQPQPETISEGESEEEIIEPSISQELQWQIDFTIFSIDSLLKNQGITTINSIPANRFTLKTFLAFMICWDDLWLYNYHDRSYNQVFEHLFTAIENMEKEKWSLAVSFFSKLWALFGIDTENFGAGLFPHKIHLTSSRFLEKQDRQNGFIQNTREFTLASFPLTVALFLTLYVVLRLTRKYKVSTYILQYRIWPILSLMCIEGNTQYFIYTLTFDLQTMFSQNSLQKLIYCFQIFLMLGIVFMSIFVIFYVKNFKEKYLKYFMSNVLRSKLGLMFMSLVIGIKNCLLGLAHMLLESHYYWKICLIIALQCLFLLFYLRLLQQKKKLRKRQANKSIVVSKLGFFINIIFPTFIRILMALSFIVSYQNPEVTIRVDIVLICCYILLHLISIVHVFLLLMGDFGSMVSQLYKQKESQTISKQKTPSLNDHIAAPSKQIDRLDGDVEVENFPPNSFKVKIVQHSLNRYHHQSPNVKNKNGKDTQLNKANIGKKNPQRLFIIPEQIKEESQVNKHKQVRFISSNSNRKNSVRNNNENIYKNSRFQPLYAIRKQQQKKKVKIEDIVRPAPSPWLKEFVNKNRLKIICGQVDSPKKREQQPQEPNHNETFEQKIDRCVRRSKKAKDSPKKQRPSNSKDEAQKRGIPQAGLKPAITFKRSLQQRANKLRALLTTVQDHPPIPQT